MLSGTERDAVMGRGVGIGVPSVNVGDEAECRIGVDWDPDVRGRGIIFIVSDQKGERRRTPRMFCDF
jgi:hypothetical protein